MNTEMTVTGREFDSFFFSERMIKEAEELAAKLFGADGTLFVTIGTTASNHIAILALMEGKGPVLIDRCCHQSIHFMFNTLGATVDYLPPAVSCSYSGKSYWDIHTNQIIS